MGYIDSGNLDFTVDVAGYSTATLVVVGTWEATLSFETSIDGVNWTIAPGFNYELLDGNAHTSTTVNGTFQFNVEGFRFLKISTSVITGTADLIIGASLSSAVQTAVASYVHTQSNMRDGSSTPLTSTNESGSQALDVHITNAALSTAGLTDAELRASPVPVSGPLTDAQLRAVDVPISGTVTVTGVSTAAHQITAQSSLTSIDAKLTSPLTVQATNLDIRDLSSSTDSIAVTDGGGVLTVDGSISVSNFPATQPISAASLPLPTDAATETTLAAMNTKTLAAGQATMAASSPVVLASNQSSIPVAATIQAGSASIGILGANSGTDIGDVTVNNAGGGAAVPIQDGGNAITVDSTDLDIRDLNSSTDSVAATDGGASLTIDTAQILASGSITNTQSVELTCTSGVANVVVRVAGTWTGNIQFEATIDGTNWFSATGSSLIFFDGQIVVSSTVSGIWAFNTAGFTKLRVRGDTVLTGSSTITMAGNDDVSIITAIQGVTFVAQSGAWSVRPVDSSDADLTSVVGTQTSRFVGTQLSRDAGRTELRFYAVAAAAGATTVQTAITLTKSSGTAATSTGTSFVITSGKRFRITNITFATRGHNTATAQTTTFNFRVNTAGAVVTTSTPIVLAMRCATPATANAWDRAYMDFNEGWEILGDGTLQFGVTAAATYTTNAPTWDVTIAGYEY